MIHPTCAGALLTLAFSFPASATWLNGNELRRHCDAYLENPESHEGALCVAFIQGFLSGNRTADEAVADWPNASASERYSDRAARTRVGSRLRLISSDARYCVDDGVPAITVIRHVSEYLDGSDRDVSTESRVHNALVQNFPCDDG